MIIIRNGRNGCGCFGCFGLILLIGIIFSSCTVGYDEQPVPRNNIEQPPAGEPVPENDNDVNVNQF